MKKEVIRRKNSTEEIPRAKWRTPRNFENMWILTEPTELRCIKNQKWYADGTFILERISSQKKKEIENNKKITTPVAFVLMPKRNKRMYEGMF